jgi:hypothetical protein
MASKVILIGGYPKDGLGPFSPMTLSGRRLRKLVVKAGFQEGEVIYFDLWRTAEEEKKGVVSQDTFNQLTSWSLAGKKLVGLGGFIHDALAFCEEPFEIRFLPHPAARDPASLAELEEGLSKVRLELTQVP